MIRPNGWSLDILTELFGNDAVPSTEGVNGRRHADNLPGRDANDATSGRGRLLASI